MRLAVFDYGAGNLHSLGKALAAPGVVVSLETDPRSLLSADVIVLPGVGAFGAAASRLAPARSEIATALDAGLPCLGVCLGMQLLFDSSEENPSVAGLGVIAGQVTRLRASRVPHMGWNAVGWRGDSGSAESRVLASEASNAKRVAKRSAFPTDQSSSAIARHRRAAEPRPSEPDIAYFAHSYACRPVDESVVTAWTVEDGDRFPSAVRWRNVVGVQFHPEKSSAPGVRFIREFLGAI